MAGPSRMEGVHRAFDVLETVASRNGASLAELVALCGLPKSTVYRILENLREAGYVSRPEPGGGWFLSARLRRLTAAYDEEAWVQSARPLLDRLCRHVVFPVALATPDGTSMLIRETTDAARSVLPDHYAPGTPVPMWSSASGKVHVAYLEPAARETLRQSCAVPTHPEHAIASRPALVAHMAAEVAGQGYALSLRSMMTRAPGQTSTIAVPVFRHGECIGALSLRYLDVMLGRAELLRRYLGPLRQYAHRIGRQAERLGRDA